MKTKLVYLILILSAVGCASSGERKLSKTQEYLKQRDACDRDENCTKEREQRFPPEFPITAEFTDKGNVERFAKEICGVGQAHRKSEKACIAEYRKAFVYRLIENYPSANVAQINIWCSAHPIECRNDTNLEQQYKEREQSANVAAEERQEHQEQAAAALAQAIEDQNGYDRRRAIAAGLEEMGNSFKQNRPVNCTSQQIGSRTYTNCN